MREILLRTSIALVTVFAPISASKGQYESLNPRNWFPLEKSNAWAYQTEFDYWVYVSTVDTVLFDLSWRRFSEVECSGPSCGVVSRDRWYSFDAEDYLLESSDFSRIDTLVSSSPMSVFRNTRVNDTTLAVRCPPPYEWTGSVTISESGSGSPNDSTNLVLSVFDENIFCDRAAFAYKIGYLGPGETILMGAIVNGLEWGDVERLRTILSSEGYHRLERGLDVEVYPKPATSELNVQIYATENDVYDVVIVSSLGQELLKQHRFIDSGAPSEIRVGLDRIPPGVFFLVVTNHVSRHVEPFVLIH